MVSGDGGIMMKTLLQSLAGGAVVFFVLLFWSIIESWQGPHGEPLTRDVYLFLALFIGVGALIGGYILSWLVSWLGFAVGRGPGAGQFSGEQSEASLRA